MADRFTETTSQSWSSRIGGSFAIAVVSVASDSVDASREGVLVQASGLSTDSKHPDGHHNPGRLPWDSKTVVAGRVTLGAFTLPSDLVAMIGAKEPLRIETGGAARLTADSGLTVADGGLYRGGNPDAPAVGDVRIRYEIVRPQTVSVVAVQRGSSFDAYRTKTGTTILLLEKGTVAADAMFQAAQAGNRVTAWILRGFGFILMFLGLFLVFRPTAVIGSVLPMLGRLASGGLGLVSFLIALVFSLVTISLAWLVYRPLLGVGLLVVAGAVLVLAARRQRARERAAARPVAATPPPLPQPRSSGATPPPLPPAS
jgi:hypothetical protein